MQGINEYSPFMYVDYKGLGVPPSPNSSIEDTKSKENVSVQFNYMCLAAACKAVITALKEELGKT
jgi:hypothetical protein